MTFRSGKSQRSEGPAPLPETTIKKIEMMKAILKRNKSSVEEYNHKQGSNASSILSLDKVRWNFSWAPFTSTSNAFKLFIGSGTMTSICV